MTASVALPQRSRFPAVVAVAPAVLLVGHVLPASGPGLALRLAGAAACVLLVPGALLLRSVAWPSSPGIAVAASFALSVAVVAFALAVVFVANASILLAAGVLVAVALFAAVPAVVRGRSEPVPRAERRALAGVLGLAVPFAAVVWWGAGPLNGDGFFHAARAQKLAELESLNTLATVSEFEDGGVHPGYLFPLWQGVDALVARLAGADPADVVVYLPAVLVPLAFVLAYAAGAAIFRSWAGGLALVLAQTAYFGLHRRDGNMGGSGYFEMVAQPQAASHLLLVTAILALMFAFMFEGRPVLLVALAAAGLALTVVHGSYTPFLALVIGGFLVVRFVLARGWDVLLTRASLALGAIVVPFGLYLAVIFPVVRNATGFTPSEARRAHELGHYKNAFSQFGDWFSLAPNAIAREGVVVVAGLLALPLAGLAARRMWAALVLGGSLAVLVVALVPPLFTAVAEVLSLAQARRLPQFLPIAFAVVGGCIVLSRLRALGVGLAAGVGLLLVLLYPGEFTYIYGEGGPGWAVWLALAGAIAAVAAGWLLRPRGPSPTLWTVAAAAAFVIPVAVAGLARMEQRDWHGTLTPGIIEAVRAETAPGEVVFSDQRTAYAIAGFAPVYVNASAPGHVVDTPRNRPRARARAASRFFFGRSTTDRERRAILDRAGADWLLAKRRHRGPDGLADGLRLVYRDESYELFRVGS